MNHLLPSYRKHVDSLLANLHHAQRTVTDETKRLATGQQEVNDAEQAQKLLQEVAQTVQQTAHARIAHIVSRCLKAVFGPDAYEFRICFEQKRGKTEARLAFVRDGEELDPVDAAGGGVVDVAAFGLRLACLMLAQPPKRRLLVLDEPFRFVSAGYRPTVRELVEMLAEEMGVQFLLVTHSKAFCMGKVVQLP